MSSGAVLLRQSPVIDVLSVTGDAGQPVQYVRHGQTLTLSTLAGVAINYPACRDAHLPETVTVQYTHGGEIPSDAIGAVAGAVARVINVAADAAARSPPRSRPGN